MARIIGPLPTSATGVKLFTGSKARPVCTAALVVKDDETITRVWPSGAAFAASPAPTDPPAPERLSTITGLPSVSASRLPIARAKMSFEPPGGYGTMNWMGLDGNVACARAGLQAAASARMTASRRNREMALTCSPFVASVASLLP